MSEIVKCEVCGKAFNKRYVNSHKRLAHGKKPDPASSTWSELDVVQEILSLYARLSDEKRKELQIRLKSPDTAKRESEDSSASSEQYEQLQELEL